MFLLLAAAIANQEHAHEQGSHFPTLQTSDTATGDWLPSLHPFSAEASAPDPSVTPTVVEGQAPQISGSLRGAGVDQPAELKVRFDQGSLTDVRQVVG
jgi:hypothetical protein